MSKPWKYQDPTIIPSDLYLNSLAKESSNGSGIILLLLWGNPKMEDEDRGGPILWALDNITEEPATSLTDSNATAPTSPKSVSDPAPISNGIPAEIKTVVTKNITASDISKRLEDIKAGSGDIQITLAWNGYNDQSATTHMAWQRHWLLRLPTGLQRCVGQNIIEGLGMST